MTRTMKTTRKMYPTSPAPSETTSITCTPTLLLTTSFTILVGMPFWVITPYESLSPGWRLPTGRGFNVQGQSSSSTSLASKYVFQEERYQRQRQRPSLPMLSSYRLMNSDQALLNVFQRLLRNGKNKKKYEKKNYHFRTSRGNLCPNLCI